MMDPFSSRMTLELDQLQNSEKKIANEIWNHRTEFIKWPSKAILLWKGCIRVRYHKYPDEIKKNLESKEISINSLSNGPAIASFFYAGGTRPKRASNPNQEWHIHHIYNGKFPWIQGKDSLRAVKDGKHFTQSAGLVAIHPIAEALAEEYFYFAWLLRHECFSRFDYDPDMVFSKRINDYGFKIP